MFNQGVPVPRRLASPEEISNLQNRINNESFGDGKMRELKLGINGLMIMAQDAKIIVKGFSFDGEQTEACLTLYPQLYDRHNVSVMLDAFTFSSTKDEVAKKLEQLGGTSSGGVFYVAKDNDVNQLVSRIQKESFDDGEMRELKMGLNNMMFMAKDAKKLIDAFSFDSAKVDAGVAIYPMLYDKNNVMAMLDAFSFSSTKDELLEKLGLK